MKKINRLNLASLAAACLALVITTGSLKADLHPVNFAPIHANAGVTATLAGTSTPGLFIATATGVVQTSLLGTCVENAQLQVQFPATPDQPVVLNGTGTFTSIDGTNSCNSALPAQLHRIRRTPVFLTPGISSPSRVAPAHLPQPLARVRSPKWSCSLPRAPALSRGL